MDGSSTAGLVTRIRSRIPHGATVPELADAAGLDVATFERTLDGRRGITSLELARVAERLGADPHWLLTGQPDPHAATIIACAPHDMGFAD